MQDYCKSKRILLTIVFFSGWIFYSIPLGVFAHDVLSAEPVTEDVQAERSVESDGVLVKFKNSTAGEVYVSGMTLDMVEISNHLKPIEVWVLQSGVLNDQALLEQLMADDAVLWVELNGQMHITGIEPNDPYFPTYQENLRVIEMPDAWSVATGSGNVIAIIDTGIDLTHPDLSDKIWLNKDEIPGNGVDDDGNGYIDDINGWDFVNNDNSPQDDHWHGSHVAGIAAAETDNGIGVAGISWGARLMPLKACNLSGSCYFDDAADAILYAADNGASIVNMSFGSDTPSIAIEDAVRYASSQGCLLISSAGNENRDVFYPAKYEDVIGVAATDNSDNRWFYSNFGEEVEIAAPGVSIASTVPDEVNALGYASATGTSMAAPHISGVASLIWSVNPLLTANQVRHTLLTTAVDIGDPGFDIYTGYGRVDAYAALAYTVVNQPDMQKLYLPLVQYEYLYTEYLYFPIVSYTK